jgi:hypothetical protein
MKPETNPLSLVEGDCACAQRPDAAHAARRAGRGGWTLRTGAPTESDAKGGYCNTPLHGYQNVGQRK